METIDVDKLTQELLHEFRYEEEDRSMVSRKIKAACQIVKNAGAYDETSDLLPVVISTITGFMLENREGMNQDFNDITQFPLSLQGLINSLRYNNEGGDTNESNESG